MMTTTNKGEVEEAKLCIENIPSFKSHLQKTLAYANILLKRIDSVKYLSNYSTCYINKKVCLSSFFPLALA